MAQLPRAAFPASLFLCRHFNILGLIIITSVVLKNTCFTFGSFCFLSSVRVGALAYPQTLEDTLRQTHSGSEVGVGVYLNPELASQWHQTTHGSLSNKRYITVTAHDHCQYNIHYNKLTLLEIPNLYLILKKLHSLFPNTCACIKIMYTSDWSQSTF